MVYGFVDYLWIVCCQIQLKQGQQDVHSCHQQSCFSCYNIPMQYPKTDIVETQRANKLKYFLSIVQKQNDSGIYFNQRLLFILSGQHFGYLSQAAINQRPQDINFQKAKVTVLLPQIRGIVFNARQLKIKFNITQGTKVTERNWIIRFATDGLCRKWYDLFQKERTLSVEPKEQPQVNPIIQPIKPEPIEGAMDKEKRHLQIISRNMQVSEKLSMEKQTKQMGTSISPKNQKSPDKPRQKPNYEQELAKIINHGQSKASPSSYKNQQQYQQVPKTEKKKDRDIRSQPSYKYDQNIHQRLQASKNSDGSNISSSNPHQSSRKNKTEIPQSRLIEDEDISPIQRFNKSRLYEDKYSNIQGKQQQNKRASRLVRTTLLEKYLGNKFDIAVNEADQLQADTEKSPTFPRSLQIKPRYFHNPLKASPSKKIIVPWTYKYIKYNHLMFSQFKRHSELLLKQLIEDMSRTSDSKKYKQKMFKNGIAYYEIDDIQVKIANISLENLIGVDSSSVNQRVSSKTAIKVLQNQFKNYNALYEFLGDSLQLRVPLVSICQYRGFIALFKVLSKSHQKYVKNKQLLSEIENLKVKSKIDCNFNENINRVIIQLDDAYYDSFKNEEEDSAVNFKLYLIQQIDHYLLPDIVSDADQPGGMIVRKELLEQYTTDGISIKSIDRSSSSYHTDPFEKRQHTRQLQSLSKHLLRIIAQASQELDSLSIYFMNSNQLSSYLHSKGINIRYLGYIYQSIKTIFQKRIIMTEMAARSCKLLLRKTLQDIITYQGYDSNQQEFKNKLCDFFNCLLGKSYETAEFWKVLSAHSQVCFGMDLKFNQIDRWYLIISLVQNCRLLVDWDKVRTQEAFKTDFLFNEMNLAGLLPYHKTYNAVYSEYYRLCKGIIESEQTREGFDRLTNYLNLRKESIPEHLSFIELQIKKYLAYFISPQKANTNQYSHLRIYQTQRDVPSKLSFEIMLIEIKWYLKLKMKEHYIKSCNDFLKMATKYYGEFHPIFSQLYDLFSAYHLTNSECEDAITFAKSSLVNVLKICGTNHQKTSEAYYHLSLCYIKANKQPQAIAHLQKSKLFFQSANKAETIAYGVMCLKLGLLYLNQNQLELSLDVTSHAFGILQAHRDLNPDDYEDEVTQCYEIMARCYEILEDRTQMKELSLHCLRQLKKVQNASNLSKMLKIYLYPVLASLKPETASTYMEIISRLNIETTEKTDELSYQSLRQRLHEDSLAPNFQAYMNKLADIDKHLKQTDLLQSWQCFKETFDRQTIKDFVSLTSELIIFLGEGFLAGSLRQAL